LANTASAKKRIRQNQKRRARNKAVRSRARNRVKDAEAAIERGDAAEAGQAVQLATSDLDRAASKGTIHRKNAARRVSRLMQRLRSLQKD
jgi:small subunit ribosomal protein S20